MAKYTQEQVVDITEREAKGLQLLKELELTPSAQISKSRIGVDTVTGGEVYGDCIIPFLQDTKYAQNNIVEKVEESLEA